MYRNVYVVITCNSVPWSTGFSFLTQSLDSWYLGMPTLLQTMRKCCLFGQKEVDDMDKLLALCSSSLYKLFLSCNRMVPCPKAYAPLLRSLATLSSVCALVIPNDETVVG